MRKNPWRNQSEALPLKFLAHVVALCRGEFAAGGKDDLPVPLPMNLGLEIDPAVGVLETAAPGGGQTLVAAAADMLRGQPIIF